MKSITIRDKRTGNILIKIKDDAKKGQYPSMIDSAVAEGITISVVEDNNCRLKIL